MERLTHEAKEQMEVIRQAGEPTAADKERVRHGLERALASAGAETSAANSSTLTKLVSVVTIAALASLGGYLWYGLGSSEPIDVVATPPQVGAIEAVPARTPDERPRVEPPPARVREGPATTKAGQKPTQTSSLALELELIRSGHRALHNGDPQGALEVVQSYRERFGNGVFQEEAMAIRVVALCDLGHSEAVDAAKLFLGQYPESPQVPRVKAACGSGSLSNRKTDEPQNQTGGGKQ